MSEKPKISTTAEMIEVLMSAQINVDNAMKVPQLAPVVKEQIQWVIDALEAKDGEK